MPILPSGPPRGARQFRIGVDRRHRPAVSTGRSGQGSNTCLGFPLIGEREQQLDRETPWGNLQSRALQALTNRPSTSEPRIREHQHRKSR